jgi:hypothetical protein
LWVLGRIRGGGGGEQIKVVRGEPA